MGAGPIKDRTRAKAAKGCLTTPISTHKSQFSEERMRQKHKKWGEISIRRKLCQIDNPIRQPTDGKYEKMESRTGSN